jgi:hypothetical protein
VVNMAMPQLMRQLWTGIAAATVAGLLSAVITRRLMHAVAHLVNGIPQVSLGCSAFIALVYIVCLVPGCLALAYSRARWPWILFSGGCALLIFEAVAIGLEETSAAHDMTAGRWLLLVVVLTAMAATYAAQFILAARWALPFRPSPARRRPAHRCLVGSGRARGNMLRADEGREGDGSNGESPHRALNVAGRLHI